MTLPQGPRKFWIAPAAVRPAVKHRPGVECLEGRQLLSGVTEIGIAVTPLAQHGAMFEASPSHHAQGDHVGGLTVSAIIRRGHASKKVPAKRAAAKLTATLTGPSDAAGNVTIVGKTFPKSTVKVTLGTTGARVATTKSNKKGRFQVTVQVGPGTTQLQVRAQSGKKSAKATLVATGPTLTPTPAPTPTPPASSTPTPIPTPTPSPSPTPTPTPTPTPSASIFLTGDVPTVTYDSVTVYGHTTEPGATVTLLQVADSPSSPSEFVAIQTTTSDASGDFQFPGVAAFEGHGNYLIAAIVAPTLILSNVDYFPAPLLPPDMAMPPLPTAPTSIQIQLDTAFGQDVSGPGPGDLFYLSGRATANSTVGTIDGHTSATGATVTLLQLDTYVPPGQVPPPFDQDVYVVKQTATADAAGNFQFTGVAFSPDNTNYFIAFVTSPTGVSTLPYEVDVS